MYKDGDLKATEDKQISLKDFYEKIYSTSDGKKDKNYLKEVFIKSTNQPLETIVKF
jgi:hypothetical protein